MGKKHDLRPYQAEKLFHKGNGAIAKGNLPKAIEAFGQSEALYTALLDEGQEAYRPLRVQLRTNIGFCLQALDQREEALAQFHRTAADVPALLETQDPECQLVVASVLYSLGVSCNALSRYEEAVTHLEEAAAHYRWLRVHAPGLLSLADLANTLMALGTALVALNRGEEALVDLQEAVTTYRLCVEAGETHHTVELADALSVLGDTLLSHHLKEQAYPHFKQAEQIYRKLLKKGQEEVKADLLDVQKKLASCSV